MKTYTSADEVERGSDAVIGESEGEDRFHIVQFGRKANFIFDLKQRSRSALSALIQGIGNPHSGVTYLPFAEGLQRKGECCTTWAEEWNRMPARTWLDNVEGARLKERRERKGASHSEEKKKEQET